MAILLSLLLAYSSLSALDTEALSTLLKQLFHRLHYLYSKWCRMESSSAAIGLSHKHLNKAMWEVWCNSPVLTGECFSYFALWLHSTCMPEIPLIFFWCRTIFFSSGESVTQSALQGVWLAGLLKLFIIIIIIILLRNNNFPISLHKQCGDELTKCFWHLLTLTTKCLAWWGFADCYKEEHAQKILPEILMLPKMPTHL